MTPDEKRKLWSQWFTQPYVAEAMWARAKTHNPTYVLEPSAGTGNLILPMDDHIDVTAFEIDQELVTSYLAVMDPALGVIVNTDFLSYAIPADSIWDLAVVNPPFENGLDLAFVLKAFAYAHRVIALVRAQFLHRTACYRELWSRPDVCLSWRGDLVPRPRFGGAYNPMDEYVVIELSHGPQTATIEYTRILSPKLIAA